MKVCCVFSLESPRRGDSNEYTQYTNFNMNKKNTLNYPKFAAMGFFFKGLRDIFLIFFNKKVCCVFSLESPRRGDSNEYTQYTIFNMNKKNTLNYPKFAAMGFFSKGLRNEFETAIVNEPSMFEPLKFYCTCRRI